MRFTLQKRLLDILVSIIGLIALTPFFVGAGCLIKMNGKGPVLFRQKRVGKDGKLFTLYKFRSMRCYKPSEMGIFEPGNTCRVTSVGKYLRRTKLDELPQLFNVLKGDMSLVGPRPEVERWVSVYPEKWQRILTVRPGITDYASIAFSDEEKMLSDSSDPENKYVQEILPRKLDLCLEYVDHHSFSGDIRILFLTFKTILFK